MKKLTFIVTFALLFSFNFYSEEKTTGGRILYVGGNGPNNYTSIQAAIYDAWMEIQFLYTVGYTERIL